MKDDPQQSLDYMKFTKVLIIIVENQPMAIKYNFYFVVQRKDEID